MPHARAVLVLAFASLAWAPAAGAHDYWEEVRTPHLRQYRALLMHGRDALALGRPDVAERDAAQAIALLPARAAGHALHARALIGDPSRIEDACAELRTAREADAGALDTPGDAEPFARAAALCGDHALATAVLERAVARMEEGERGRAGLFAMLGDMRLAAGPAHVEEAVAAFREGLRAAGDEHVRARLGLALALLRAGQPEEARLVASEEPVPGGVLESALGPGRALLPLTEVAARAAVAHEAVGDLAAARVDWQRATEGGPWADQARAALARLDAQTHVVSPAPRPARPLTARPRRAP